MVKRTVLPCCALAQITCNDSDSKEDIEKVINQLKKEAKYYWYHVEDGHGYGQRAAFVVTTPMEKSLERNLRELGFEVITEFERRVGYPAGQLKMWFLKW